MFKTVAFSVGARYAFSRRSSISFISSVAVLGLALSIAVLVIVVSVINGFERELKERVLGVLPHLTFYGQDPVAPLAADVAALTSIEGITGAVPFVQGAGLAAVSDQVRGVLITGIEPEKHGKVSTALAFVEWDTNPEGDTNLTAGEFRVLLGAGVARQLGASLGDTVTLVLPAATVTPAGLFPRQKRFTVVGLLDSQSEVDARTAYIHLADAQRLYRLGGNVHGYQVRIDDLFAASHLGNVGRTVLGPERFFAQSWMRTHGNLFRAIGVQKTTMFVLLSFLVAVAAFNLVSTLVMVVEQRSSDVAILRTLGSESRTVLVAFVLLGCLLGGLGIVIGTAVGLSLALALPDLYSWLSSSLSLDLMNQYFVSYLPVEVRIGDLWGILGTAVVLCILSTLYPAWRAVGLKPAEVLAHE